MPSIRRDRPLRYSVVFSPEATSDSLQLTYAPAGESEKEAEDGPPSLLYRILTAILLLCLRLMHFTFFLPLQLFWAAFIFLLRAVGIEARGTTIAMQAISMFVFRPLMIIVPLVTKTLSMLGVQLNEMTVRQQLGLLFNGFGFTWHAIQDTLTTPPAHWQAALERFQTFMEKNGLDLEMQMAINGRFWYNMSVYDDVQRMMGLGPENRVQETLLEDTSSISIPSMTEAAHFMHFATAAYGSAVIFATLIELGDDAGIERIDRVGGQHDGLDDQRQVLAYLKLSQKDLVVTHLKVGGSMDVLRHFIVVDHSTNSMVFAIRGTFSISGVISDWVSYAAPFCGGVGHVAMSEVATKMWDMTKKEVMTRLQELPTEYELVITGHSLGAGVATLLTILLLHEKALPDRKIRCLAFAPPPTFYPLSAAKEAVDCTTAYIHGNDTVPFLSVGHLRRFFKNIAALNKTTKGLKIWDILRIDWGYEDPSPEMIEAVRKAEAQKMRVVKGSESLAIPAKAVVWLKESADNSDVYNANLCDARKLSRLPICVPGLQRSMLQHHLASQYESALKNAMKVSRD